jgi:NADH-quinone oxidoreductase subunit E
MILNEKTRVTIDAWLKKYPADQKRSAILTALHAAQDQNGGWLSKDIMDAVAAYLELQPIQVYEVATFYDMYELKPCGKNKIRVCTNISCMLRGSDEIAEHLKKRLKIDFNESTPDQKFMLKESECLAACAGAPMMQVENVYYENLTPEKVDSILEEWEKK